MGMGANDGVAVNAVFTQIWNLLGVVPALLWALLVPTAQSGSKVPTPPPSPSLLLLFSPAR